jgi:hypothetical protein
MGDKGVVAILAGNQKRTEFAEARSGREECGREIFRHQDSGYVLPQRNAAGCRRKVEQVMQSNPDITGWAMIGGGRFSRITRSSGRRAQSNVFQLMRCPPNCNTSGAGMCKFCSRSRL